MVPVPPPLSGQIKGSFAYITIKDRLPVILTKVIDHLCREKLSIIAEYGEESSEDLKLILGKLSQLKNELQTNKPFRYFQESEKKSHDHSDGHIWNEVIKVYKNEKKSDPKWYSTSWLLAECFFYKTIHDVFESSKILHTYDPFKHQKVKSCEDSLEIMRLLSEHVVKTIQSGISSEDETRNILCEMIQVSLWGNQCDLSLSSGESSKSEQNLLASVTNMSENILAFDFDQFWNHLQNLKEEERDVAIILDNAGLELFADFCLATILVESKLMNSVTFYTKTRPWFVSDTTLADINWILQYLRGQGKSLSSLSDKFSEFIKNGVWKIREHKFWTLSYDFSQMKEKDSDLYEEMKSFSTIIFKGDLNYRKLVGDLDWPTYVPLKSALRGFLPSSLLILRTVKGGPSVGLNDRSPAVIRAKSKDDWNISGDFGMIQFVSIKNTFHYKASLCIASIFFAILISYLAKRYKY